MTYGIPCDSRKDGSGEAVKPIKTMDMDDIERRQALPKVACHGP